MNYKTKDKIDAFFNTLWDRLYKKIVRPIKKWKRRRDFEARRVVIMQAKGEIIEQFDKFMLSVLDESMTVYRDTKQGNHYTVQATHDIRAAYENVLFNYINSTK